MASPDAHVFGVSAFRIAPVLCAAIGGVGIGCLLPPRILKPFSGWGQSALADVRAARAMSGPPGATGPTGDWEKLYATSDVATLPWYNPKLDEDIDRALKAHDLTGGRILDLGTGPATQAMHLAKRGYEVLATDISSSAIKKAKAVTKEAGLLIEFRVDNVLRSRLEPNLVDAIIDRGVFHVMPKDKRPIYVETVHRILRPNGWLFLKCFSDKEPGTWGPFRIAKAELLGYFRGGFDVESVIESRFQGNVAPPPKALFAVFRKREPAPRGGRAQKSARKRSTKS